MKLSAKIFSGSIKDHILSVLVWLAALAAIIFIIRNRNQQFDLTGVVQGLERQITAPCNGRIKTITINLFDKVEQSEPIIIIDTVIDQAQLQQQLNAKRDTTLARIKQLQAQLIATGDKLTADASQRENAWITDSRNFSVDVEKAGLETVQLKAQIAPTQYRLKGLELNIKIATNKMTQTTGQAQIETHYEIEKMKTEAESLKKEIEEKEALLRQAEETLKQTNQRLEEFSNKQRLHTSVELALKPIEEEINVENKLLAELMVENPVVVMESPMKGIIQSINIRPGEIVAERTPLLTIVESEPRVIVAYVSETQINSVKENMKVQLVKRTYPQKIATSYVAYLGPVVELMPNRLWLNSATPQWGRPVIIPVPDDLEVLPGELVSIQGI